VSKPRLLDLFCGAGGAGMGYHRAGFEVVGVDINPQPHYPFEFHQADALEALETHARYGLWPWFDPMDPSDEPEFDAIHASPPCQGYANVTRWTGRQDDHPALIPPVREGLTVAGLPFVIENVRTNALRSPIVLCGSQFGLPIRRHRYFETGVDHQWFLPWFSVPCCHRSDDLAFNHKGERAYAAGMGCGWMTVRESRQAIPPAYTEWVGARLLASIEAAA